jgi:hypothetical protein
MNRPDREDAVARALDMLPPGDPAASDPRLVRDPELAEEARATREAVADLWLAVSPLRAAPPEVLHSVMDKIDLPAAETPGPKRRRLAPLLAASGWAAAAAVAICLWPRHAGEGSGSGIAGSVPKAPPSKASARGDLESLAESGSAGIDLHTERLRREYASMQKAMEMMRRSELATLPRVMSLTTPGSPRRSPEESRKQMFQKMFQIVSNSFRDQLDVYDGEEGDKADFVIEHGYMQPGMDLANDDIVLRHRNFPEYAWQERGFWHSDDGSYYDPARHLLWEPDPAGGGFLGRRATEDSLVGSYTKPDQAANIAKVDPPKSQPEGFVLEDPVTKKAEVVIDQVPAPRVGFEQRIQWTDASGASGTIPVVAAASASTASTNGNGAVYFTSGSNRYLTLAGGPFQWNGNAGFDAGTAAANSSTVMASFSTTSTVTSFQLIEVPLQAGAGAGSQGTVIVAGGN